MLEYFSNDSHSCSHSCSQTVPTLDHQTTTAGSHVEHVTVDHTSQLPVDFLILYSGVSTVYTIYVCVCRPSTSVSSPRINIGALIHTTTRPVIGYKYLLCIPTQGNYYHTWLFRKYPSQSASTRCNKNLA